MQTVTVGTKYQIVIPKEVRKIVKGFMPGSKVKVYPLEKNVIAVRRIDKNWVERTYGMMSKAWQEKDPIAELEKMRDEWERKD